MCLQRVTQPFLRSPASQWQPLSTNGEDLQQWSTFPGVVSSAKLLINEGTEDSSRVSQKNPAKRTAGLFSLTQGIRMAWASVEELEGNHCWQKDSLHSQFAKKKKKRDFQDFGGTAKIVGGAHPDTYGTGFLEKHQTNMMVWWLLLEAIQNLMRAQASSGPAAGLAKVLTDNIQFWSSVITITNQIPHYCWINSIFQRGVGKKVFHRDVKGSLTVNANTWLQSFPSRVAKPLIRFKG